MLEHPHLAPELVLDVGGHVLGRPRPRARTRPVAVLHHEVREAQVVPEPGVDLAVGLAPDRVDRPVRPGHRMDERLARPQPHLVAPVDALLVRAAGRVHEPHLAAGHPDRRVSERRHELAERVGVPLDVGVAERDDLAGRLAHGAVLGGNLASALAPDQADAARLEARDDVVGGVDRVVGRHDDLEPVARIVERKHVLELSLDDVLLVVRRHDQRDGRQDRGRVAAAAAAVGRARRSPRVAEVGPGERGQAGPEDDLEGERHAVDPTDAARGAGTGTGRRARLRRRPGARRRRSTRASS